MIELIGKLINWQTSLLHVGLSLDDPTYAEGYDDWAALSGQRVRVTVEAVKEPEPRCPFCGGEIEETPFYHFDGDRMYAVSQTAKCLQCGAHGEGETKRAALAALAEWLAPCEVGKARYHEVPVGGETWWQITRDWVTYPDPDAGHIHLFDTRRAAAQWWNKREGRE